MTNTQSHTPGPDGMTPKEEASWDRYQHCLPAGDRGTIWPSCFECDEQMEAPAGHALGRRGKPDLSRPLCEECLEEDRRECARDMADREANGEFEDSPRIEWNGFDKPSTY